MLQVLGFTKDGHAIVSTEGLFRVVINPGGEIAEELIGKDEAEAAAEVYNACGTKRTAVAVSYCQCLSSA